ncbi:hypothetical protein AB0O31_26815 [Kitasatospora cineracea]|uniref:RNA polymerase sigma factor n=1 Tax=Kitasatospora cineracea TaxID=88074 RepID=UPI0034272764
MSEVAPGTVAAGLQSAVDGHEGEELLRLQRDLVQDAPVREAVSVQAWRLANDQRLIEVLRADGFSGARYERFSDRIMTYGWKVVLKMTETGEVFRRVRAMNRPVPVDKVTQLWTRADRAAVTTDSVVAGMALFHEHALVRGGWSPTGGANLATYFVGATLRTFPRIYLRWYEGWTRGELELGRDRSADSSDHLVALPDPRHVDPATAAADRDEAHRLLSQIPDQLTREGIYLRSLGYSQAEAAELVGLTPKALERRVGRARALIRSVQGGESGAKEGGAA